MPTPLRPELRAVVDALLATGQKTFSLDALGDAIGARAASADEIDAMMRALEAEGRVISGSEDATVSGEDRLKKVLASARVLRAELGRAPKPAEIAAHAGLDEDAVRHALGLARTMQG